VAAVTGIAPRDEAEAMLAAQMVGVHWIAMALLNKAGSTNDRGLLNDAGNMAVKLLRTYTAQLETLKRYRSAGEQRVVVQHQHVNVTADQAAVQVNGVAPDPGANLSTHLFWCDRLTRACLWCCAALWVCDSLCGVLRWRVSRMDILVDIVGRFNDERLEKGGGICCKGWSNARPSAFGACQTTGLKRLASGAG
jgi:hypothetical protein